jgi:hypothetical protein
VNVVVDVDGNGDVDVADQRCRRALRAIRSDRRRTIADLHVAVAVDVHDNAHADDHVLS